MGYSDEQIEKLLKDYKASVEKLNMPSFEQMDSSASNVMETIKKYIENFNYDSLRLATCKQEYDDNLLEIREMGNIVLSITSNLQVYFFHQYNIFHKLEDSKIHYQEL